MKFFQKRSFFSFMIALGVGANLFCGAVLTARAEVIDYQALAEANLSIPVESNEIKNWPEGPILNAARLQITRSSFLHQYAHAAAAASKIK